MVFAQLSFALQGFALNQDLDNCLHGVSGLDRISDIPLGKIMLDKLCTYSILAHYITLLAALAVLAYGVVNTLLFDDFNAFERAYTVLLFLLPIHILTSIAAFSYCQGWVGKVEAIETEIEKQLLKPTRYSAAVGVVGGVLFFLAIWVFG